MHAVVRDVVSSALPTPSIQTTPTSAMSLDSTASPTSTAQSSYSLGGNTKVFFVIASAIGGTIGILFLLFTLRYFVRAKFGLHVYSLNRRTLPFANGNDEGDAQWEFIWRHHDYLVNELHQRFLTRGGAFITTRNGRRRRGRFAKMKKLSEAQVDELFPTQTYKQWLQVDHAEPDDIIEAPVEPSGEVTNEKTVTDPVVEPVEPVSSAESAESAESAPPDEGTSDALHFSSGGCAICLEPFDDDDVVRGLVCGHPFHAECLDPWLTKRRACCPMCKRDYYQKQTAGADDDVTNDNASDFTIDLEALRDDPSVRAMLQELVPPSERVRSLMEDPEVRNLGIEARARDMATRKYGGFPKMLWWKFMGISKQDIVNWFILELYAEHQQHTRHARRQEIRAQAEASVPVPEPSATPGNNSDTSVAMAAARQAVVANRC
ncbi:hypothetical protein DICA3_B04038 [Diutina catenulata]